MQKHCFVIREFRKRRLPLLFIALIPSLVLDGCILFGFITGQTVLPVIAPVPDLRETLTKLAASFVFFKSVPILFYLRLRAQRAKSYVLIKDEAVIYRKSRLMGLLKTDWKNGYAFNDDIEIINPENVRRGLSGGIVVRGIFKEVRRLPETNAYYSDITVRRAPIPGYYEDMEKIADKLSRM